MEFISKQEYESLLNKVKFYEDFCQHVKVPCAICGEHSELYHRSIIGVYRYFLCDHHHNSTVPYYNGKIAGLHDLNREPVDMPFLEKQREVILKVQENG